MVHLLRQDDEQALSALYLRFWDKLLSVACHRLHEPEEAEEIVQDIFIKLWQRRDGLELTHSLATYLAVAVKYRVINFLDQRGRKRVKESRLPDLNSQLQPSAEEYIFENELRLRIEATVKSLPDKCQIVFRMSREDGLSNREISKELDIAEKTVEAHMSKALRHIRGNLTTFVPPVLLAILEQNKFHL
nr:MULTISPECIES: RNA polymerase sigma-70 factor [unclassified Pedobacter]